MSMLTCSCIGLGGGINCAEAISQIKRKEYCRSLEEYAGNALLVGVNYNKRTKVHECMIKEYKF